MVFSDTSNKNGLIQTIEFWTRHPDAGISGDATLLKQITTRINSAFEKIMPLLLLYSDHIRWDDSNHTDAPIGTTNLVANQNDYKFAEDDNSLDILNITNVRILHATGDTRYHELRRVTADSPRVPEMLAPDSEITGIPSDFLELGGRIYLDRIPDYSATAGLQIFFGREQVYFTSADTTAEPGIPKPFHELLALHASLDWILVNRPSDGNTIGLLRETIKGMEEKLKNFIDLRNPTKVKMTMRRVKHF